MAQKTSSKSNEAKRIDRDIFTHDQPVIVDGTGSVALEFDGTHSHAHYNAIGGSVFTGVGLFISSVSVRVRGTPGSGTQRPLPTPFCTVAIESRDPQTQDVSIIRVRAIPGAIVISVDSVKFSEHTQNGNRKRLRNPRFQLESLTIREPITDAVIQDWTDLLRPHNNRCFIDIIDDHILRDTDALIKRFAIQAE